MKIVLDTNVLISALIKTGKPWELFCLSAKRKTLVLSREILEEFLEVSDDSRIKKYVTVQETRVFLKTLTEAAKIVKVKSTFRAVIEDPDDDTILRTAYDGKADYIVSGDKHLLSLGEFRGIRIVQVDEMIKILNDI